MYVCVTAKFGYSVIRVTRITEFGDSGHPKNTEETEFGDNRPKPLVSLAKNGISFEGITIFLEKISAKTPNPELLRSHRHNLRDRLAGAGQTNFFHA
jgi:hypothetical protein